MKVVVYIFLCGIVVVMAMALIRDFKDQRTCPQLCEELNMVVKTYEPNSKRCTCAPEVCP